MDIINWLIAPDNWTGAGSIPYQIGMHLLYTFIALFVALLIAIPSGIYIGHTGKGERLAMGIANSLRALPTLGLLILIVLLISPLIPNQLAFVIPALVVLVLLAVPPILAGVVTGIQLVDPDAIDAARGLGFTNQQIIWRVEVPCALPLSLSGVRGATLQVVSTATVAAYVSLEGLGRYIIDGQAGNDFPEMLGGAALIAILALLLELFFVGLTKVIVSKGLTRVETTGSV